MENLESLRSCLSNFVSWLDYYGELSQDQYDFWANPIGGKAKSLYYKHRWGVLAVAPFVFLDTFLPGTRAWFRKKTRFPIADAHYAMGFFNLYRATGVREHLQRGFAFLESLERTRCPGWNNYCWGYPFNWVTIGNETIAEQTPLITATPYAYEAFVAGYELDREERKLEILQSIADHVFRELHDTPLPPLGVAGSYTPLDDDQSHIVNATAYRAFLLTDAGIRFQRRDYLEAGKRNTDFLAACQRRDGSWSYAADGTQDFVDNFHTCFVLKCLAKIERLTSDPEWTRTIDKGFAYYLKYLLDSQGLPIPFAAAPRMTVHNRELYDYAECINLCLLLRDRYPQCTEIINTLFKDLQRRWQKRDGSFRTRKIFVGWNNVPYHRWAQSQTFRSLTLWYLAEAGERICRPSSAPQK
jgi:hypothetical protein